MKMTNSNKQNFLDFLGKSYVAFWYYILIVLAIGTVGKITQVCDARRRHTLEREYFHAMKENDSERAIRYAKKLVKRKETNWIHGIKGTCPYATILLGFALEASGDLDGAEKTFKEEKGDYFRPYLKLAEARIAYKKGDFQKAFTCYCDAVSQWDFNVEIENLRYHVESFERFRDGYFSGFGSPISPFADFGVFLRFMEEECAKVDNPQEYAPIITRLYLLQQESEKRAQENERESKPDAAFDKGRRRANDSASNRYSWRPIRSMV